MFLHEKEHKMQLTQIIEILKGLVTTLILTAGGCAIGFCGGISLALFSLRCKRNILLISDILRGTPMILQAIILKVLVGHIIPALPLAILVFGINSIAYSSQIVLSATNAIDENQLKTAQDLGLPDYKAYKLIILPQALKNAIPALLNEFNSLLKESAIVGIIEVNDLLSVAEKLGKQNNNYSLWLFIAGGIYLIISSVVKTTIQNKINKRGR